MSLRSKIILALFVDTFAFILLGFLLNIMFFLELSDIFVAVILVMILSIPICIFLIRDSIDDRQSVGKRLTKIKMVHIDGTSPSKMKRIVFNLLVLILYPFELLSLLVSSSIVSRITNISFEEN